MLIHRPVVYFQCCIVFHHAAAFISGCPEAPSSKALSTLGKYREGPSKKGFKVWEKVQSATWHLSNSSLDSLNLKKKKKMELSQDLLPDNFLALNKPKTEVIVIFMNV